MDLDLCWCNIISYYKIGLSYCTLKSCIPNDCALIMFMIDQISHTFMILINN